LFDQEYISGDLFKDLMSRDIDDLEIFVKENQNG
jgi:hypothetical protein